MKRILLSSLACMLLFSCNTSKNTTAEVTKNEKKGMTIEEYVNTNKDWELIEDSVKIDGILCDKYKNKNTGQVIYITLE